MMKISDGFYFRRAEMKDADTIWKIMQEAIVRRKEEGSDQWQDGYPNPEIIRQDIENGYGFIASDGRHVFGYLSLSFDGEPAYDVEGVNWQTDPPYGVVHRLAIGEKYAGKGWGSRMMMAVEKVCIDHQIRSIRIDTNFDNHSMLRVLEKLGYDYRGDVMVSGSSRRAYEKRLRIQM